VGHAIIVATQTRGVHDYFRGHVNRRNLGAFSWPRNVC
jgi:hypothetical protein